MRALRICLVLFVVLGVVLVVVDRIVVNVAEGEAAGKIRTAQGLAGTTDVDIKGFPFLTQVAAGRLGQVDVEMTGVQVGAGGSGPRLMVSRMTARLTDVTLDDGYTTATATRAEGSALIGYGELAQATGREGITMGYGGDGKVKVSGTAEALDAPSGGSVLSSVSVTDGNTIRLRVDDGGAAGQALAGVADFEQPVGGLPAGIEMSSVTATEDGLSIGVTGAHVRIAG